MNLCFNNEYRESSTNYKVQRIPGMCSLVVHNIKRIRKPSEGLVVHDQCTVEEARGLDGIARAPFFGGLLESDALG